jgi:hypothetical protein
VNHQEIAVFVSGLDVGVDIALVVYFVARGLDARRERKHLALAEQQLADAWRKAAQ